MHEQRTLGWREQKRLEPRNVCCRVLGDHRRWMQGISGNQRSSGLSNRRGPQDITSNAAYWSGIQSEGKIGLDLVMFGHVVGL